MIQEIIKREKELGFLVDKLTFLKDIETSFKNLYRGHSEFQIRNFILNNEDFPLIDDKYYQSITECYARYQALISAIYNIKKISNETKLLELDLGAIEKKLKTEEMGHFVNKRFQIKKDIICDDIDLKNRSIEFAKDEISTLLREMYIFADCITKLGSQRKYKNYEDKEAEHWKLRMDILRQKGQLK